MSKKFWVLTLLFALLCTVGVCAEDNIYLNDGEVPDLEISTPQQLKAFADEVNAGSTYEGKLIVLTEDIDLSAYDSWTPIGNTMEAYFAGTFNGMGHTVYNMKINGAEGYFNGLFGCIYGGAVKYLDMKNVDIDISQVNFEVDGTTPVLAGGIAGFAVESEIFISEVLSGNIVLDAADIDVAGGVVGLLAVYPDENGNISGYASVRFCGNKANISGSAYLGGIVGYCMDSSVEYSYNKGSIEGSAKAAGIVNQCISQGGEYDAASVSYCYNTGRVTGSKSSGLLCSADAKTQVYSCVDYAPNTQSIYNMGSMDNVLYNAKGSLDVTGSTDGFIAIDINGKTQHEISEIINGYYISVTAALDEEYPVFWWESNHGESVIYGDVNSDGVLSYLDAAAILRHITGAKTFSENEQKLADYSTDGSVNLLDAILMQGYMGYQPPANY